MPNEHRADPTPPPHHGQGRGGSKKESSSLRVSPALHPPERPSPRRADIADHGLELEALFSSDSAGDGRRAMYNNCFCFHALVGAS